MNLSVGELFEIGKPAGAWQKIPVTHAIRDISTDSRTLKPGDLFIALRGESFDGHDFVDQVMKRGALAVVVDSKWYAKNKTARGIDKKPLVVVKDTLNALGALAKLYRKKFDMPIVVIAGSNGKTTTKELIGHVLGSTRSILKTQGNFNNQVGLPKMLFQLRDGHACAVLEIGTNHPGEIAWLVDVAQPTHALITNIGREHLEFFKDLNGVAREERVAFDFVKENGGTAFVNIDDKLLASAATDFPERAITYGESPEARVFATRIGFTKDGRLDMRLSIAGKTIGLRTHIIADYAANVIAAAAAVASQLGMKRGEIKAAVETYKPHSKRLEVMRLATGVTVINDAYNANPDSMASAARTLESIPALGKKYFVAGDMFELGDKSPKEHQALGRVIAEFPFAGVYFTGKAMMEAFNSFKRKSELAKHFPNKEALAADLSRELASGDVVLIKGSRGMRMEEIIDLLQRG